MQDTTHTSSESDNETETAYPDNSYRPHGWLNVYKPEGQRSFSVVQGVKRIFNNRKLKVGHAGTLDSFASGVLAVALGEATKTSNFMMDQSKDYDFDVSWGTETDTLDPTGRIVARHDRIPTNTEITEILHAFIGNIEQIPPSYSAIKINGVRASTLMVRNNDVQLRSRVVSVQKLALDPTQDKKATISRFTMTCGKGTYVRSLARDMAYALGTVAHVSRLCRTRIGSFTLSDARALDDEQQWQQCVSNGEGVHPLHTALFDIPWLIINTHEDYTRICHGRSVLLADCTQHPQHTKQICLENEPTLAIFYDDNVIGLATIDTTTNTINSKRLFNTQYVKKI